MAIRNRFALFTLVVTVLHGQVAFGYPGGAPASACSNMTPDHGHSLPQSSPSPFVALVEPATVKQGNPIKITLQPQSPGIEFRGFLVMAFDSSNPNGNPIGTFAPQDASSRPLTCINANDAITHNSRSDKSAVVIHWTPPNGYVGPVVFKTTFVKHYLTFWVKTLSATANVVPGNSSSTSSMNGPTLPMSLILTLLLAIIMKNY